MQQMWIRNKFRFLSMGYVLVKVCSNMNKHVKFVDIHSYPLYENKLYKLHSNKQPLSFNHVQRMQINKLLLNSVHIIGRLVKYNYAYHYS